MSVFAAPTHVPAWKGETRTHVLADSQDDSDVELSPAAKRVIARAYELHGRRWARVVENGFRIDELRAKAARPWKVA